MPNISTITHPEYLLKEDDWAEWRYAYSGGKEFREQYLKKFSTREDNTDFTNRKAITPIPSFAKAGINDIKNAIFQRLVEVQRLNGSITYLAAVEGRQGGLTTNGQSMANFIGEDILPELLAMGKVGIYVDMPAEISPTLKDARSQHPYLYAYHAGHVT